MLPLLETLRAKGSRRCASDRFIQAMEAGVTHLCHDSCCWKKSLGSLPTARPCLLRYPRLGKDLGRRGNLKLPPQLQEGRRKRGSWFFSRTMATVSSVLVVSIGMLWPVTATLNSVDVMFSFLV